MIILIIGGTMGIDNFFTEIEPYIGTVHSNNLDHYGKNIISISKKYNDTCLNEASFFHYTGYGYFLNSELDLALYNFNKSIKLDPYDTYSLVYKSKILELKGEIEESLNLLMEANSINSHDFFILNSIGNFYIRESNYDCALDYLLQAYYINPDSESILSDISNCYYRLNNYDKYYEFTSKSYERFPNKSYVLKNFALACKLINNYDDSIFYINEAITLNPNDKSLYYKLTKIYEDRKKFSLAIDLYNKMHLLFPDDIEIPYKISCCYFLDKHYEKCIDLINKHLNSSSYQGRYYFLLMLCYKKLNDIPKLIDLCTTVINIYIEVTASSKESILIGSSSSDDSITINDIMKCYLLLDTLDKDLINTVSNLINSIYIN